MNAWSKLPNAKHIDWVLDSSKSNKNIWIQAVIQARIQTYMKAFLQAYEQAHEQVYNQSRYQAWKQARIQARIQAYDQAYEQSWDTPFYDQVSGVLLALIAYDDCDQYLSMTFDELKTWALVSEKPQAILLLPMKWVLTKI